VEGGGFTCVFPLRINYSVVSLPPTLPRGFEFAQHASETTQLVDASLQRTPALPSEPSPSNHLIRLSPSHSHLATGFASRLSLYNEPASLLSWSTFISFLSLQRTLTRSAYHDHFTPPVTYPRHLIRPSATFLGGRIRLMSFNFLISGSVIRCGVPHQIRQ
jgi:hypothetical protein